MHSFIQLQRAIPLFVVALTFGLSPIAQAVTPAPDGGYANENTAEGDSALFSLTAGTHNTASGFQALFSNTTGSANTANGHNALGSNTTGNQNTASGGGVLASNRPRFCLEGVVTLTPPFACEGIVGWNQPRIAACRETGRAVSARRS
jgi:hypothetical protein